MEWDCLFASVRLLELMSDDEVKEFKFHLSCDLQLPVRCKIESLQIASSYEGWLSSSRNTTQ